MVSVYVLVSKSSKQTINRNNMKEDRYGLYIDCDNTSTILSLSLFLFLSCSLFAFTAPAHSFPVLSLCYLLSSIAITKWFCFAFPLRPSLLNGQLKACFSLDHALPFSIRAFSIVFDLLLQHLLLLFTHIFCHFYLCVCVVRSFNIHHGRVLRERTI